MPKVGKRVVKFCSFHDKDCEFTSKGTTCIERRNATRTNNAKPISVTEKDCIICKKILPASQFHRDKSVKTGLKGACKVCVKERDYKRYNTWEGYVQKKVVASWSAHGNSERVNKLEVNDGLEMLKAQNYKCLHCKVQLECTFGTQIKKNYYGASLDRIDVSVVGYGNGNSQWLCMCCNNGKNTMDDEEHKQRFHSRDNKILELEELVKQLQEDNKQLKEKLNSMEKVQRLDGSGCEDRA